MWYSNRDGIVQKEKIPTQNVWHSYDNKITIFYSLMVLSNCLPESLKLILSMDGASPVFKEGTMSHQAYLSLHLNVLDIFSCLQKMMSSTQKPIFPTVMQLEEHCWIRSRSHQPPVPQSGPPDLSESTQDNKISTFFDYSLECCTWCDKEGSRFTLQIVSFEESKLAGWLCTPFHWIIVVKELSFRICF